MVLASQETLIRLQREEKFMCLLHIYVISKYWKNNGKLFIYVFIYVFIHLLIFTILIRLHVQHLP